MLFMESKSTVAFMSIDIDKSFYSFWVDMISFAIAAFSTFILLTLGII